MTLTPMGPGAPSLPPVLAGMDKAEALAWISRAFDSAAAGDVVWDDAQLIERFLAQCSRTNSEETRKGYGRELDAFRAWRWNRAMLQPPGHPTPLRGVSPQEAQDWVDFEREQVNAGHRQPRSFNRRVAAVSAMFRWASEPSRSGFTGVPRNPLPRRQMLEVAKQPKPLSHGDLERIIETIEAAMDDPINPDLIAARDLVLIRGSYLVGCRVSELAGLRWGDVELLDGGDGQIHLIGKGSKARTVRVSVATMILFHSIRPADAAEDDWVFPSERRGSGHLTRQGIGSRVRHWGKVALGPEARVWPHRLRSSHATHAIREGVDVFTLQSTLGHASTSTTQNYVAANPADSSSLRLG
mgnify:CR=1 FL=1